VKVKAKDKDRDKAKDKELMDHTDQVDHVCLAVVCVIAFNGSFAISYAVDAAAHLLLEDPMAHMDLEYQCEALHVFSSI
jgi:hypothetical protein